MLTERYDFESFSPDMTVTEAEMACIRAAISERIDHQKTCSCTKGVNWWITYPYEIKDEDDNVVNSFTSTLILAYHSEGSRIIVHRTFSDGTIDVHAGLVRVSLVEVDEEFNEVPAPDDGTETVGDDDIEPTDWSDIS